MQQKSKQLFLDRYEVIEELGSGGFSKVYKAFDTRMERLVAIKVIPSSSNATAWAKREAQTSARLNHPGIATIYEYDEINNNHYLIMEYLEGITLREIIDNFKVLKPGQAVAIASEVCIALEHAHLNYVVHRDIKPENIMILSDGRVKITDFGTARLMSEISRDTKTVATPAYMSPEQAKGERDDDRTDQFSLGTILYEMLTGINPFESESTHESLYKVVNSEPKPPSAFNKDVNDGLDFACLKALSKDMDQRFATVTDFRYKIERSSINKLSNKQVIRQIYNRLHGKEPVKTVPDFVTNSRGLLSGLFKHEGLTIRLISGITPSIFILFNTQNIALQTKTIMALALLVAGLIYPLLSLILFAGFITVKFFVGWPVYGIIILIFFGLYLYYYASKKPFEAVFPLFSFIFAKLGAVFLFPLMVGLLFSPVNAAIVSFTGLLTYGLSQFASGKSILFLNGNSFIILFLQVFILTSISVAISVLTGGQNNKRDTIVVLAALVALVAVYLLPQWGIMNLKINFFHIMQNISLSLIITIAFVLLVPYENLKQKGQDRIKNSRREVGAKQEARVKRRPS